MLRILIVLNILLSMLLHDFILVSNFVIEFCKFRNCL